MGRLAIVEEGQEGPAAVDSSGRIPEARNNNSANSEVASPATSTSVTTADPENKRKAGNSDESGYLGSVQQPLFPPLYVHLSVLHFPQKCLISFQYHSNPQI